MLKLEVGQYHRFTTMYENTETAWGVCEIVAILGSKVTVRFGDDDERTFDLAEETFIKTELVDGPEDDSGWRELLAEAGAEDA
jgi:hypothetical protein